MFRGIEVRMIVCKFFSRRELCSVASKPNLTRLRVRSVHNDVIIVHIVIVYQYYAVQYSCACYYPSSKVRKYIRPHESTSTALNDFLLRYRSDALINRPPATRRKPSCTICELLELSWLRFQFYILTDTEHE